MRILQYLFAFLFAFLAVVSFSSHSIAQTETPATTASDLEPLLERARKDGMSVIIVQPQKKEAVEESNEPSMQEQTLAIRAEVRRILKNAPNAFQEAMKTLRAASPDGTWWWFVIALVTTAGSLGVASFISWRLRVYNQSRFKTMFNPEPKDRAEKVGFLLFRATMILINIVIMLVVALLVALIFDQGHDPTRATILVLVVCYSSYWFFRAVVFFNIIAHDLPNHRMINLTDEDAVSMQRDWRNSMVAIIVAFGMCAWMDMLGLNRDTHKLFLVGAFLISTLILIFLVVKHWQQQKDIVLGAGLPATRPLWRRVAAAVVNPGILLYLVVAWLVSSVRLLADLPSANLLVIAPSIAFIVGLGAYAVALVIIDKIYISREKRYEARVEQARLELEQQQKREEAARLEMEAMAENEDSDAGEEMIINMASQKADLSEMPAFKPVFKPLFERAVGIIISIVAVGFILGTWDVNAGERGNPVTAFIDTLAILFVGWLAYKAMALYIDSKLEEEGPLEDEETDEAGEGGGHGATRLQTLLPLVRNVLLATIVVIIGMIFLSSLGVDIAPLFAGAGVVGLAVGFGAQTLIRDIFSGGFFLFDDAFRKGEYIEVGNVRGVVEKISLRSFQLRHHNGPLHTLPFGEITQLTNYSRDWVIMKLPLRVTYDTDVEKVRKLVKKAGQRLMQHPEYGSLFLQPMKSQGVVQMEDSAIIIRVKFMTTPGNQWVLRKVVYGEIQEVFQREGIKFAHKEVTVRIAEDNDKPALTDERKKQAASAAARSVIDGEAEKGSVGESAELDM